MKGIRFNKWSAVAVMNQKEIDRNRREIEVAARAILEDVAHSLAALNKAAFALDLREEQITIGEAEDSEMKAYIRGLDRQMTKLVETGEIKMSSEDVWNQDHYLLDPLDTYITKALRAQGVKVGF